MVNSSVCVCVEETSRMCVVTFDIYRPLLDMLLVVVLSPAVMMLFIYLTWRLRQRQRRKNELAPTDFVTRLPTRKFRREKQDQQNEDHAECAICLEDYIDDDILRTLPCRHEFHASCVDAWLTTHKKFVSSNYIFSISIIHDCYSSSVPSVNMTFVARLPSHQQNAPLFSTHSLLLSVLSTIIHHIQHHFIFITLLLLLALSSLLHSFPPFITIHFVTYNCCINNLDEQSLKAETFGTLDYNERAPRFSPFSANQCFSYMYIDAWCGDYCSHI